RSARDSDHLVTAVYNIAFARDEDVFSLSKKNSFRSARRGCVAVEFQVNRWRGRRRWRASRNLRLRCNRNDGLRDVHEDFKNISSGALVFRVLADLQKISSQSWIERLRRSL